jgi:hypothetical protein
MERNDKRLPLNLVAVSRKKCCFLIFYHVVAGGFSAQPTGLSHQPTSQSSSRDKDEPSQQWVVGRNAKGRENKNA